jgi:signal peptidase I
MTPSLANPDFCRLAGRLIAEGMDVRLKARGNSMQPWIRNGDMITLGPADPARLKRGDVIAFETAAGRLTIHRLVDVRAGEAGLTLVTRGDARAANDPPFGVGGIVGRVIEVWRGGQRVRVNGPAYLWRAAFRRRVMAVRRRARAG